VIATFPFFLFHGYLFLIFHKLLLFADAEKSGGWGGVLFSYPLSGLIAGLKDPGLLLVRKIYTVVTFLFYLTVFSFACYHFFKTKKYRLLAMIIIPYFIFTLFLKGNLYNWWMLSLPRFLIPLAPFGFILLLGELKARYLYLLLALGTGMAIAYVIMSQSMHLQYGPIF
jgi:hypothetical protein